MLTSRKLFPAIDLQVQAFYAIVDQKFHGKQELGRSMADHLNTLHKEYSPISHAEGKNRLFYFMFFFLGYIYGMLCLS